MNFIFVSIDLESNRIFVSGFDEIYNSKSLQIAEVIFEYYAECIIIIILKLEAPPINLKFVAFV